MKSSKNRKKTGERRSSSNRLTLMRVTVVEARNLVMPDGQACRPYVSIRVGSQLGQTKLAGGFKWNGQRIGRACGWYQSFDLVVRQRPDPADLEDILSLRLLSYQVLKPPQVLGKTDISVQSLGDPFRPPDSSVVFLEQAVSTNLQQQFAKEASKTSVHEAQQHHSQRPPASSLLPHDNSSLSPTKRKKRGERSGRHALMHRCAQDFWVPLTSVTTHSSEGFHVGEIRLRVLLLPIPTSHRLHTSFPWLTQSNKKNGKDTKSDTQTVDARDETPEDLELLNNKLREQLTLARSAHDASHTTSQHRTEWAWGKGGGGYDSGGDRGSDSEDDEEEHRNGEEGDFDKSNTGLGNGGSSSNMQSFYSSGTRNRTESMVSLKESVALMSESPSKKKRVKSSRWRKGKFALKVEEDYGWDFTALPKTPTTTSITTPEGISQVSQEVVNEMVREQHNMLLESRVGKWLKPVAWAIRNPPAFGELPYYPMSGGEGAYPHNTVNQTHSSSRSSELHGVPHLQALELRKLVLSGPPNKLRCQHGRGGFKNTGGSWLNILPSAHPNYQAIYDQVVDGRSNSFSSVNDVNLTTDQLRRMSANESPPPPPPLSSNSSPVIGRSYSSSNASPNMYGGHTSNNNLNDMGPLPVLGRLRASVPRVHVVADGTTHVATYRVRVTLSPPSHLPNTMKRMSSLRKNSNGEAGAENWEDVPFIPSPFQQAKKIAELSNHQNSSAITWDLLRRFSEFEALLNFLVENPKAGTAGSKLKQLVTLAPKSLRSVLKWSMTPEFLEERRVSLETALVVLLDACRVPSAVCGYKGISLSPLGQAALLRFLEVPETFFTTQPEAAQITKIAAGTLKRFLYCPTKLSGEGSFDYLDIVCDDDDGEEEEIEEPDNLNPPSFSHVSGSKISESELQDAVAAAVNKMSTKRRYEKVLHFRCFVWILISGCLKKLAAGVVFKPFSSYDEVRDKLIAIRKLSNASNTPNSGPYRYLATSFSQIDLDIWRTKMKPVRTKTSSGALRPLPTTTAGGRKKAASQTDGDEEVSGVIDEAAALTRVLRAFVLCKPDIGYCQAMNYVALFLLRSSSQCCDERSTLALLICLAEDIVPGYWSLEMQAMQADMALLNRLVSQVLPSLSYHLSEINLPLDLFAAQWLVSLFSAALPPASVCKVWDWLFLDGPVALLCVSLALLRRSEAQLLLTDDLQKCAEILNNEALLASDSVQLLEEAKRELSQCEAKGLNVKDLRGLHSAEIHKKKEHSEQIKRSKRIALAALVRLVEGTGNETSSGVTKERVKSDKRNKANSKLKRKVSRKVSEFGQRARMLFPSPSALSLNDVNTKQKYQQHQHSTYHSKLEVSEEVMVRTDSDWCCGELEEARASSTWSKTSYSNSLDGTTHDKAAHHLSKVASAEFIDLAQNSDYFSSVVVKPSSQGGQDTDADSLKTDNPTTPSSVARKVAVVSADTSSPFKKSVNRRRSLSEDSLLLFDQSNSSLNPPSPFRLPPPAALNRTDTACSSTGADVGDDSDSENEESESDNERERKDTFEFYDENDLDEDDEEGDEVRWAGDRWTVIDRHSPSSSSSATQPNTMLSASPGQMSLIEASQLKLRMSQQLSEHEKGIIVNQPTRTISTHHSGDSLSDSNSSPGGAGSGGGGLMIGIGNACFEVVGNEMKKDVNETNGQVFEKDFSDKTNDVVFIEKKRKYTSSALLIDHLHGLFLCMVKAEHQVEEALRLEKVSNNVGLINRNDSLKHHNGENVGGCSEESSKRPSSFRRQVSSSVTQENSSPTIPSLARVPFVQRVVSDSFKLKFGHFDKLMRPALKYALMNNLNTSPLQVRAKFKKNLESIFIAFRSSNSLSYRQQVDVNHEYMKNQHRRSSTGSAADVEHSPVDGEVDWQEILHCWALLAGGSNMTVFEKLNLCFCVCDRSCVGSVDRSEVAALLSYSLDMFSPKVSSYAAEAGLDVADPTTSFSMTKNDMPIESSIDSTGVSYSSDSVPLILDDLFPPSEHTSMPRLSQEKFVESILQHPTALDFLFLGASAHLRSQVSSVVVPSAILSSSRDHQSVGDAVTINDNKEIPIEVSIPPVIMTSENVSLDVDGYDSLSLPGTAAVTEEGVDLDPLAPPPAPPMDRSSSSNTDRSESPSSGESTPSPHTQSNPACLSRPFG